MNNPSSQNIAHELGKLDPNETQAVVRYISNLIQKRFSKPKDAAPPDDLIGSLADAYENKRARAVVEWEKARRQNIYRSA